MDKKDPKTPEVTKGVNQEGVQKKEAPIMHSFTQKTATPTSPMKMVVAFMVIAFLGIGTGFMLSQVSKSTGKQLIPIGSVDPTLEGKTFGSDDLQTFKDSAEGTLKEGGIEGEGQFHLSRPGGDSQNVYLTSSLVDLSQFVGRKIKVWGETQRAQHAGWLMDVGRVEVL